MEIENILLKQRDFFTTRSKPRALLSGKCILKSLKVLLFLMKIGCMKLLSQLMEIENILLKQRDFFTTRSKPRALLSGKCI
ncbi:hypothetical protein, partial [Chryseobacterium sp. CH1]|uniref:hypothetical protein n=1 Tax=Chryseobacterium sp. CH1 TaxID=713551 RepID=UPI0010260CCD